MKKALITGITGQDGSYLAEFLLSKGYEVHGIIRRASTFNTQRIDHIYKGPHIRGIRLHLHYGDLSDSGQLTNLVYNIKPDEIYLLGAQRHVRVSFDIPEYTSDITGLGTTRILEAVRSGIKCKFYQASSSEMFGDAAIYFDPTDKLSMLNSIQKVIYNDELKKQLINKGIERVKKFTWKKTAEKTKKLYEKIL